MPSIRRRYLVAVGMAAATSLALPWILPATAGIQRTALAGKARPTHVVRASGDIDAAVARFRGFLGHDNGGGPGGKHGGRREINWDGVPDQLAEPNALPSDFFNATVAPRARGAILLTPGDHVAVSADSANPTGTPPRFGDINPAYANDFHTYSGERLFSPIGSNIVNLRFRVPGTQTPAAVRGFGAVYTDVDLAENTAFKYYDAKGKLLGTFRVPRSPDGLSFLGVTFAKPVVARVRIEYGTGPLGPDETSTYDAAVMDDFIYGEPQPIGGY
jgi:hypothetical protein